jgi:hypothetical protein
MREVGYVEGANLVLECRDALGRVDRFPALTAELARLKVDVLFAESTPATVAAARRPGQLWGSRADEPPPSR